MKRREATKTFSIPLALVMILLALPLELLPTISVPAESRHGLESGSKTGQRRTRRIADWDTMLASDSQYCPNCGKQILQKAVSYQENTPQGGRNDET